MACFELVVYYLLSAGGFCPAARKTMEAESRTINESLEWNRRVNERRQPSRFARHRITTGAAGVGRRLKSAGGSSTPGAKATRLPPVANDPGP